MIDTIRRHFKPTVARIIDKYRVMTMMHDGEKYWSNAVFLIKDSFLKDHDPRIHYAFVYHDNPREVTQNIIAEAFKKIQGYKEAEITGEIKLTPDPKTLLTRGDTEVWVNPYYLSLFKDCKVLIRTGTDPILFGLADDPTVVVGMLMPFRS